GYAPVEVTRRLKEQFPQIETATVLDKMREYKELFPVDQTRMPPAVISQEVRADLEPNQIQYQDGSREDYSVAINRIKNDDIRLENVFALYNTPGVSLGSNVKSAVEDYIRRKQPEILQTLDESGNPIPIQDLRGRGIQSLDEYSAIDAINVPTSYQFLGRQLLGAIKEGGREGLETLGDIVGGEDVGDLFRGDFMGGDPDMFMRSGGRDINAVTEMAKAMNNPDQIRTRTGFIGDAAVDTISDLFGSLDMSTPNLDALVDQTREKTGLDPIDRDLENINEQPVSNEAKNGGQPVVENQEVPVIEVEEGGGDGESEGESEDQGGTSGTGEAAEPDITDGEATKRNFGEFIQSPDFIRFARNLGKGLATTGQIGQGIALGAAGAAEEKYAEEVAERETLAEILTEQAKKGGMDVSDRTKILKVQQDMNQSVRDYNNAVAAQELAQSVLDFADGNADLASFASKIGATVADVKTGFTGELDDPSKLSDTRRAQIALEILTNRNIKEILGESGRTISNIDRDIAKRVVGSLDNLKLDSVAAIKLKLDDNIGSIIQKRNEAQRNIKASVGALAPLGIQFDDEIVKIFRGELGQTGIPGSYMSGSNPYPNITFIDATK
ncbi:MAG: hypothetical protein ACR2PE_03765, partial [Porticoccus sp.]